MQDDVDDRSSHEAEGAAAGEDQSTADSDQTAADADETSSDADQAGSDSDQADSDRDQLAADRDQAAADRALGDPASTAEIEEHEHSRADRGAAKDRRRPTSLARDVTGTDRERSAVERDRIARQRDLEATKRDAREEARAQEVIAEIEEAGTDPAATRAAVAAADEVRETAARARRRAADDRERAARDRKHAAADRARAALELGRAHLDDLTGVYVRGAGLTALTHEVARAHRSNESVVLAYVDIVGLKKVNDADGHEAGDLILRAVSKALLANLRPYDPVVRMGGDEFVCLLSGAELEDARARFDEIHASLDAGVGSSISVGLAKLRPAESLEDLLRRADAAMYAGRRGR